MLFNKNVIFNENWHFKSGNSQTFEKYLAGFSAISSDFQKGFVSFGLIFVNHEICYTLFGFNFKCFVKFGFFFTLTFILRGSTYLLLEICSCTLGHKQYVITVTENYQSEKYSNQNTLFGLSM